MTRSCTPAPEVEGAWQRAWDEIDERCGYHAACWRSEIEAARDLRERHPEDLLAHRLLVSEIRWSGVAVPEVADLRRQAQREYSDLSLRYPRNPAYPYLQASLEQNRRARRDLIRKSVALDPTFPWSHDAWVREFARKPSEDERRELREHFDVFARSCPMEMSEILTLLSLLEDREAWNAVAPSLRREITSEGTRLADLPALWAAEFKYADPSDHQALRERVRRELETLRGWPSRSRTRLKTLRAGYELTGNDAARRMTEAEWIERFPCERDTTRLRRLNFQAEHGKLPEGDDAAARRWLENLSAAMKPWLAQCPSEPSLWQYRLYYLSAWGRASESDVEQAADRLIALVGERAGMAAAQAYLEKGVRLDRVTSLIDAVARQTEEAWAETEARGLEAEDLRRERSWRESELYEEQALRVRLALAQRESGAAGLGVARLSELLDQLRKSASSAQERPKWEEAQFWDLQAQTQALAGKNSEALTSYARALELDPEDQKVQKAAHLAYVKIHEGEQGFEQWRAAAEQAGRAISEEITHVAHRPLPELRLKDVAGKTWTSAELRGKVVLINFWATWCGPCQQELPNLQKLYEGTKGRRDLAILTVSIDQNPGLIQPFLARQKYTFPVLLATPGSSLEFLPRGAIPLTYIVDPQGMIVQEQEGFGGDGDRWLRNTTASLEAAAR